MAEEAKLFKELEIGFRELFRIVVPGAYILTLAHWVVPDSQFSKTITQSVASGLAATFFLGLIGYALRPHEVWFPFFIFFEKKRKELNDEIARVTGLSQVMDNVAVYKYFLDGQKFSERIHYFSSFYYMLSELSLFSAIGAYFMVVIALFQTLRSLCKSGVVLGILLIAVACLIQLVLLLGLTSLRTRAKQIALYAETGIAILALVWMLGIALNKSATHAVFQVFSWTPLFLLILSYLFWRLAEKHWGQIIDEQIVLVNAESDGLKKIAQALKSAQTIIPEKNERGSSE